MSKDTRFRQPLHLHEFNKIRSHERVIHVRMMRRAAMVPLVDRKDWKTRGQFETNGMPVIGRAEEAMQDDERLVLSINFGVKLHASVQRVFVAPRFGEERMALEISVASPMAVPACLHQNGFAC